MGCAHPRWIVESPQEARERWSRDAIEESSQQTYRATCKVCGAEKPQPSDKQIDDKYDQRAANEQAYAIRHRVGDHPESQWDLIVMPEVPWIGAGPMD